MDDKYAEKREMFERPLLPDFEKALRDVCSHPCARIIEAVSDDVGFARWTVVFDDGRKRQNV